LVSSGVLTRMIFVTVLHFIEDFFVSFLNPLGPYFVERFQVSPRSVAVAISTIAAVSAVTQIFFGYLSDGIEKKWFYLFTVSLVTSVASMFVGFAPSLAMTALIFSIISLSNSAFHPMGASIAGSKGRVPLALFTFAGSLGTAAGPIFVTSYVSKVGIEHLWIVGAVSLAVVVIAGRRLIGCREAATQLSSPRLSDLKPLLSVWLAVAFRSFSTSVLHIFGPMHTKELGLELTFGGLMLSTGLAVGTFTNFLGSKLSEKLSFKHLNALSFIGMGIFMLIFGFTSSPVALFFSFVAVDAFMFLTMSANVGFAQERLPRNRALASSISMGFSWATGNAMNILYSSILGENPALALSIAAPLTLVVGSAGFLRWGKEVKEGACR